MYWAVTACSLSSGWLPFIAITVELPKVVARDNVPCAAVAAVPGTCMLQVSRMFHRGELYREPPEELKASSRIDYEDELRSAAAALIEDATTGDAATADALERVRNAAAAIQLREETGEEQVEDSDAAGTATPDSTVDNDTNATNFTKKKKEQSDEIIKDVVDVVNSTAEVAKALKENSQAEERLEEEANKLGKSTNDDSGTTLAPLDDNLDDNTTENSTKKEQTEAVASKVLSDPTESTTTQSPYSSSTTVSPLDPTSTANPTSSNTTVRNDSQNDSNVSAVKDEILEDVSDHVNSTAHAITAVAEEKAAEQKLQKMVEDAKEKLAKLEEALNKAKEENQDYTSSWALLVLVAIASFILGMSIFACIFQGRQGQSVAS